MKLLADCTGGDTRLAAVAAEVAALTCGIRHDTGALLLGGFATFLAERLGSAITPAAAPFSFKAN